MRLGKWLIPVVIAALAGCRHTKPGTHVELVDKGGQSVYVSGAANMGTSKTMACRGAVQRSVAAIALRFAQENEDSADEIAEAVGTENGAVFMQRYAKADALSAAVQDIEFDPIEHVCKATVRWTPPIFVKEAVLKYAEKLKTEELNEDSSGAESGAAQGAESTAPSSASPPPAAAVSPPAVVTPPPPPVSVAPPPAASSTVTPAPPPPPQCARERKRLTRTLKGSQTALDDFKECMRRTSNDEGICHRYKLYVDEAQKKEDRVGQQLADCLNAGFSVNLRKALGLDLAGHAAVSVETRPDGTVVLWTFSPVDQTAFAVAISPEGHLSGKTALAANQVQWVRGRLNL